MEKYSSSAGSVTMALPYSARKRAMRFWAGAGAAVLSWFMAFFTEG